MEGLGSENDLRQRLIVNRHIAPAEQRDAFFRKALGYDRLAARAQRGVPRHEDLANGIAAGLRQLESETLCFCSEEFMRNLNENARPVAGKRIGANRTPVLQVQQDLQTILHDLVAFHAFDVGDQAEAAGIVLVGRMIETLGFGEAVDVVEPVTWMHRGFGHGCLFGAKSLNVWRS